MKIVDIMSLNVKSINNLNLNSFFPIGAAPPSPLLSPPPGDS